MLQIQLDLSYEVKPVSVSPSFGENHGWLFVRMRDEFRWDGSIADTGAMDARDYIPLGSSVAFEGDTHIHVMSSEKRREWM